MASEAEHVRPRGQAQFLELRELAEAEARGDVTSGVVTVRDFVKHKTVKVKKGHRYVARKRKRG